MNLEFNIKIGWENDELTNEEDREMAIKLGFRATKKDEKKIRGSLKNEENGII